MSELQAQKAGELVAATGVSFEYRSFPDTLHAADPQQYVDTLSA